MLAITTSLAYFPKKTQTQSLLHQLPAPQRQVAIAGYGLTVVIPRLFSPPMVITQRLPILNENQSARPWISRTRAIS